MSQPLSMFNKALTCSKVNKKHTYVHRVWTLRSSLSDYLIPFVQLANMTFFAIGYHCLLGFDELLVEDDSHQSLSPFIRSKTSDGGSPVVRVSDYGGHTMSSSPVKTRRVGERCTLNLSRSPPIGVVVWRGGCQLRCRPHHLTMVRNSEVRCQKTLCSSTVRRTVGSFSQSGTLKVKKKLRETKKKKKKPTIYGPHRTCASPFSKSQPPGQPIGVNDHFTKHPTREQPLSSQSCQKPRKFPTLTKHVSHASLIPSSNQLRPAE
ncbi:hypothetical protein TNCV_1863381 [Trichonephila clavipes]|nr:hypothetical protein TNCV_1863381 [Trichonephila clavipes]